jgi:hypothetical protein
LTQAADWRGPRPHRPARLAWSAGQHPRPTGSQMPAEIGQGRRYGEQGGTRRGPAGPGTHPGCAGGLGLARGWPAVANLEAASSGLRREIRRNGGDSGRFLGRGGRGRCGGPSQLVGGVWGGTEWRRPWYTVSFTRRRERETDGGEEGGRPRDRKEERRGRRGVQGCSRGLSRPGKQEVAMGAPGSSTQVLNVSQRGRQRVDFAKSPLGKGDFWRFSNCENFGNIC